MRSLLTACFVVAAVGGSVSCAGAEQLGVPRDRLLSLRGGAPASALVSLLGEPAAKAPGCVPGGPAALWLYPVSITLGTDDRIVPAPLLRLEFDAAGVLVARSFVDGQAGIPLVVAETREQAAGWLSGVEPREGLPGIDVVRDLVVGTTRRTDVDRRFASWRPEVPCGNGGRLPVWRELSAGDRTVLELFVDRPSPLFVPAHACLVAALDESDRVDTWWLQGWLEVQPRSAPPSEELKETPARADLAERPILHATAQRKGHAFGLLTAAVARDGSRVATLRAHGGAWAPAGALIAWVAEGDPRTAQPPALRVTTLQGEARTLRSAPPDTGLVGPAAWTPDGLRVSAFALGLGPDGRVQSDLMVARASDGVETARVRMPEAVLSLPFIIAPLDRAAWAPRGDALLVSWESACVVELATRRVVRISEEIVVAEWSPDGEGVYYVTLAGPPGVPVGRDLSALMYRALDAREPVVVAAATELARLGMGTNRAFRPAALRLSPSGTRMAIVTGTQDGAGSRLRIVEALPGGRMTLGGTCVESSCARPFLDADWSPDETRLAFLTVGDAGHVLVETFDVRTGTWTILGPAGLDLLDLGSEGIDELGAERLLSWSQ